MNTLSTSIVEPFRPLRNNNKKLLSLIWFILALLCLGINYISGPQIQFSILFVLPVLLSSWYNGKYWGYIYAITLPLVQFYFFVDWQVGLTLAIVAMKTMVRILVLLITALLATLASQKNLGNLNV